MCVQVHSWQFVDDASRRAAARALHRLLLWLVPAALLLGVCSARRALARWRGAAPKVQRRLGPKLTWPS